MSDDFAILAAVAANPSHPYALLEHLQTAGVGVTRSTLYRRAEALVAQGWLQADDIRGDSGHYRRALTITRRGRERLAREAVAVLASETLESPLFALAVSAAGAQGPGLAELLRPRMAAAARALTAAERGTPGPGNAPAIERRIAHLRADITWLQALLGRRLVERTDTALERAS
jgi:DNA-binding PadR family transcriptional regulator